MSRKNTALLSAVALVVMTAVLAAAAYHADDKKPLAHIVVFTLKEHSPEEREQFVKSCHEYLSEHEGTLYFAVGTIAEDVVEPQVSDRDFDVVLHLVFDSKESEQKYIKDPRHQKFVEENRASFGRVRVFDSYVTKPK